MSGNTSNSLLPSRRGIILGAGRHVASDMPAAIVTIDANTRVLDWILNMFDELSNAEITFVGGYDIQRVEKLYPDIRFKFNQEWSSTGPADSLDLVPLRSEHATYVTYADVVIPRSVIQRMEAVSADLVIAVDSHWTNRFESRSKQDLARAEKVIVTNDQVVAIGTDIDLPSTTAEFAGLLKINGAFTQDFQKKLKQTSIDEHLSIPQLIQKLIDDGCSIRTVDVRGDWAELNAPQDLARFVLGTKAESLDRLRPLLTTASINDQIAFTQQDYLADQHIVTERIREVFTEDVIVRSSALSEDTWLNSAAGAYESVLHVPTDIPGKLEDAIAEVFDSYLKSSPLDQVLVQAMLKNVNMSGVVMTRTPSHGAPYFVINYDAASDRTDSVTAGDSADLQTLFLHHDSELAPNSPSGLTPLVAATRELIELVGHDSLDIEFAVTDNDQVQILQVRPIVISHSGNKVDDRDIAYYVTAGQTFFKNHQIKKPFVLGSSTQLSVMADWNPAEMIGSKPEPLAFSLYRHLITDDSWAQQRAEYGYRDVRPNPLIVDVLGHPYVDVRVDFNSFVPAALDDSLAERLIEYYLAQLNDHPEWHDKVEFEVLFTCMSLDFGTRSKQLLQAGFSESDITQFEQALVDLTNNGIKRLPGDLQAMDLAEQRFYKINQQLPRGIEKAQAMVSELRRFGIPLFSHLARNGFVAIEILNSLVGRQLLTKEQREAFLSTLETVPTIMQQHALQVSNGKMSWDDFVANYGHLRPGSYNITSTSYDSKPEMYLRPMVDKASASNKQTGHFTCPNPAAITEALHTIGLQISAEAFFEFAKSAIEGREFGKFKFMRCTHEILESIAAFGAQNNFGRDDLAYLNIQDLAAIRNVPAMRVNDALSRQIEQNKSAFAATQAVVLPDYIAQETDFSCVELGVATPNFVSGKKLIANIAAGAAVAPESDLKGKIVAIPNADPGYDWLFGHEIGGLITQYGGVNSHMAIRVAEFQLPAAIGVGESIFSTIVDAETVELDCGGQKITVIN